MLVVIFWENAELHGMSVNVVRLVVLGWFNTTSNYPLLNVVFFCKIFF